MIPSECLKTCKSQVCRHEGPIYCLLSGEPEATETTLLEADVEGRIKDAYMTFVDFLETLPTDGRRHRALIELLDRVCVLCGGVLNKYDPCSCSKLQPAEDIAVLEHHDLVRSLCGDA